MTTNLLSLFIKVRIPESLELKLLCPKLLGSKDSRTLIHFGNFTIVPSTSEANPNASELRNYLTCAFRLAKPFLNNKLFFQKVEKNAWQIWR